jgi:hypothetical protein
MPFTTLERVAVPLPLPLKTLTGVRVFSTTKGYCRSRKT